MSWPSSYGYKYTPIGLRQRDIVEDSGKKTVSTTVHLPAGGHLLDIERKYSPDGSVAKKESSCMPPSAFDPIVPHLHEPANAPAPREATPAAKDAFPAFEPFEHRPMSDLEKKADDIINNFRARHQTGLDALRDAKQAMRDF